MAIKKSEGLIGLNPYPFFIDPGFKKKRRKNKKKKRKIKKIAVISDIIL